jgi:predicted RNase H-like HicB family nuclease
VRHSYEARKLQDRLISAGDGSWVAEIPAISGCYALMSTREEAPRELSSVFPMIADEHSERGIALSADSTEIVNA